MKKVLKGLLMALILMVPLFAKADMGAPEIPSYEAVITTKDGADTYDYSGSKMAKKGHLAEGTKIEVTFELTEGGETYLSYNYNGKAGDYVLAKDVAPMKKEVTPADISWPKSSYSGDFIVYEKDAELKKGPSDTYGTYTKLSKGTKGKVLAEYSEAQYIYVEANGQKGWLSVLGRNVLISGESIFVTGKTLSTTCGKIPTNTAFYHYYKASMWDSMNNDGEITLVNYNDCETFIPTFKEEFIAYINGMNSYSSEYYYKTTKKITVYEDINFNKEVGTIAAGEVIGVFGNAGGTGSPEAYIALGDVKGWINQDDYNRDAIEWYTPDTKGYNATEAAEAKKQLQAFIKNVKEESEKLKVEEEEVTAEKEKEEEKEDAKEEKKEKKKEEKDSKDVLIICLIAALAFACGALATIVLSNKKKNNKVEEKKESKKEDKEEE